MSKGKPNIAREMYRLGFKQEDIALKFEVDQSTISRWLRPKNLGKADKENFYENWAYGAFTTESGERVLFNRQYKPLDDKKRFVENVVKQEWFYTDATPWPERIENSIKQNVVYEK